MRPDDALDSVLLPVLWELREHLSHLVLIGGWVPQPRTARNNVFVLLSQPDEGFLSEVSGALQVRHGWSQDLAKARARGFLSDFADLIPQDCGK
jgi:hypothetical protein